MFKIIILISILVLLIGVCFSQHDRADSIRIELLKATTDTSRVMGMAQLSDYYKFNRPDSAIFYGNKALRLAREINFPKGELMAYQPLVVTYNKLGNISKALQLNLQAIKIAERNNFKQELAGKLLLMGNVYSLSGNYRIALDYFRQSKILSDSIQDEAWSTMSEGSMGASYLNLNMSDSATYHIESAYKRAVPLNIDWVTEGVLIRLGHLEKMKGNHMQALNFYKQALSLNRSSSSRAELLYHMAKVYQQQNKKDSAILFANESLDVARKYGFLSSIINSSVLLAELYESNDLKRANQFNKMAIIYKDSVIKLGNVMTIEGFIDFDSQERQLLIESATKEYQNKARQYALLAGLCTFLLIAFILYRNNKQKQNANQVLESTLDNLKSTQSQLIQSEKMASLGELTAGIAHEIQNPLNFVNNFSEVNSELIAEMKEEIEKGNLEEVRSIAESIEENEQKIITHGKRADAIVKGMLAHSRTSTGQKEPTDLNALCEEYLRLAWHGLKAKDKDFNAQFKTDFDSGLPKINVISQDIGRVLLNLVNNAFYVVQEKGKHNIPGYEPKVMVTTKRRDDRVGITVSDNGPGIPEAIKDKIFQPFFTTKPTGEGTGLGLSLSYDIVRAHGGEMTVAENETKGASFTILLPIA